MSDTTDNGWIKISRKITKHWLWHDAERLKWWIDMLFMAAYEDTCIMCEGRKTMLKRGQFVASVSYLCNRWGRSKPVIIAYLQTLSREHMIQRQTLYRYTAIITICNYDKYQCTGDASIDTIFDVKLDTIIDTIVDTNKGNKEIKNISETEQVTTYKLNTRSEQDARSELRVDLQKFMLFFNAEMDSQNAQIRRIKSIDGQRKTFIEARAREHGKDALVEVVKKAARSSFLNGGGSRGFIADATWLFRPNNFVRVLEGSFDDNNNQNTNGTDKPNVKPCRTETSAAGPQDYSTTF